MPLPPPILVPAAVLALLASTPASAQWWSPTYHRDVTNPNPKIVYTHEHIDLAKTAANAAIFNDQFPKLERMYAEFLETQLRTTDATYMVEALQAYFAISFRAWATRRSSGSAPRGSVPRVAGGSWRRAKVR